MLELNYLPMQDLRISLFYNLYTKLNGGSDFGFSFKDKARFRVSVLKAKGNFGIVLRQIPYKMFGLREIGLPDKVKELLFRPRGLVVVTGPTGSGLSLIHI